MKYKREQYTQRRKMKLPPSFIIMMTMDVVGVYE